MDQRVVYEKLRCPFFCLLSLILKTYHFMYVLEATLLIPGLPEATLLIPWLHIMQHLNHEYVHYFFWHRVNFTKSHSGVNLPRLEPKFSDFWSDLLSNPSHWILSSRFYIWLFDSYSSYKYLCSEESLSFQPCLSATRKFYITCVNIILVTSDRTQIKWA